MDEFKQLLAAIGVPPVIAAGLALIAIILVFFIKRHLDQMEKQDTDKRETLKNYLLDQEQTLLKAYRMLYEGKNLTELSQNELIEIIGQADNMFMEVFTRYRARLPDDVIKMIYDDIHSPLAQFLPNPSFRRAVSPNAVHNLVQFREEFLRRIESVKVVVNRHL